METGRAVTCIVHLVVLTANFTPLFSTYLSLLSMHGTYFLPKVCAGTWTKLGAYLDVPDILSARVEAHLHMSHVLSTSNSADLSHALMMTHAHGETPLQTSGQYVVHYQCYDTQVHNKL